MVAFLCVFTIRGLHSVLTGPGDFAGYVAVGELVLQGEDIYQLRLNTWPPVYSVLFVPFALLARIDLRLAAAVWLGLSVVFFYGALALTLRLVYSERLGLSGGDGVVGVASVTALAPIVLTHRFIHANFGHLQINILILLLSLLGCVWLTRRRSFAGGAIIGIAAAIKVFPIFLFPYLAWKRWWRAFAAAVLAGGLLSLSPLLVFGFGRFWRYVHAWFVVWQAEPLYSWRNQSVVGMLGRLDHGLRGVPHAADSLATLGLVAWIGLAVSAGLFAAAFVFTGRSPDRDPTVPTVPVEFAIVLVAAVLFVPRSFIYYFVFLLPANAVLWRAVTGDYEMSHSTRRIIRWLLVASFILGSLTSEFLLGEQLSVAIKSFSGVTVAAILALVGLFIVREQLARRSWGLLSYQRLTPYR